MIDEDINRGEVIQLLDDYYLDESTFFPNKILSKLVVIKVSDDVYRINIYAHHMLWDSMTDDAIKEQMNALVSNNLIGNDVLDYYEYIEKSKDLEKNDSLINSLVDRDEFIDSLKRYKSWFDMQNKKLSICRVGIKLNEIGIKRFEENSMSILIRMIKISIANSYENRDRMPFSILYHGRDRENIKTVGMLLDAIPYLDLPNKNSDIEISKLMHTVVDNKKLSNYMTSEIYMKEIENYISVLPTINF